MRRRLALGAALFGAGVAVALVLNLVLLGMTTDRDDPVGRLTPVAVLPAGGTTTDAPATARAAGPDEPAGTTSTTSVEPDDDDADEGRGRGRGRGRGGENEDD